MRPPPRLPAYPAPRGPQFDTDAGRVIELLLSTNRLGIGGTETYLLTLAEHLDRLGHRVLLHAHELGPAAEDARRRGLTVVEDALLPATVDGIVAQDAAVSFELAARYPGAPQVFVAHSTIFDLQSPPQLPGLVARCVALNDRVARRIGALASPPPLVRLRQPIDVQRFPPGAPLPRRPRRALVLSNRIGSRLDALRGALERRGIEVETVGVGGDAPGDPRDALHRAHVVIGYGRSVLEGMACGRAALVYDHRGGDGWVTRESYPALEAEGFAGAAGPDAIDPARLDELFDAYEPGMGAVNADLIATHHKASPHAEAVVGLFRDAGSPRVAPAEADELARLVRLQYRAQEEAIGSARRAAELADEVRGLTVENSRLRGRNEQLERLARSPRVRLATALPSLRPRRRAQAADE